MPQKWGGVRISNHVEDCGSSRLELEGEYVAANEWQEPTTTPFIELSLTCVILSLPLFLRHMLGHTHDQQLYH